MPTIRDLLRDLPDIQPLGDLETNVTGIAYDSRLAKPGDLFVALPGFHTDGAGFIPDAIRRGAVAVVTQNAGAPVPDGIPCLTVKDARLTLTNLSAVFYGYPARQTRVVGVTGTDGKTTTTYLISASLEAMGYRTGFITTADVKVADQIWRNETQHTTPEPVEIQGLLRRMVDEGVGYAVLESSSHALALDRMLHCEFDAAVFTNLSPEHLNFHGSMESYLRDKMKLFSLLDQAASKGGDKVAILNADDPHSLEIAAATRSRVLWYGIEGTRDAGTRGRGDAERERLPLPEGEHERARGHVHGGEGGTSGNQEAPHPVDLPSGRSTPLPPPWEREHTQDSGLSSQDFVVKAVNVQLLPHGSRFVLVTPLGSMEVESRLAGRFNVYNWLAAATVGLSQGASLEQIRQAMALVDAVPGRMQRIDEGQQFSVVVDFAHTPQALQTVLGTLRPITPGRLIVLFGMAGERDPGNRPEMGRVAARLANLAIFTVDDPRFENPMEIAEQIAGGAKLEGWREGREYLRVADREEAIREALRWAQPGDTVLLAGKGHETRQVIGEQLVPWNDGEVARRVLREMIGR